MARRDASRRRRSRVRRSDRGYIVVLLAALISTLLIVTALVIDLSLLRDDRRADQKVADAAGTAAAVALATTSDGQWACANALDSATRNLPGVTSFTGADCSVFPTYCDPTTPSKSTTGTSGPYTLTIVHPVNDFHPFMTTSSSIGATTRSVTPGDGDRCRRFGVEITLERPASFAGVVDSSPRTTGVHTVALASSRVGGPLPINLLILERRACDAIRVEGQGNLIIAPSLVGGVQYPGVLAVESDGTGTYCADTSPSRGTLNVVSANVRADGPPGCNSEITPGTGHGCGDISLFAPGVPGPASPGSCKNEAYRPACTTNASGTLWPNPKRMGVRYTRGAVDHMFNCRESYTTKSWFAEHPVNPCFDAFENEDLDYIDELVAFAGPSGTPAGFTRYNGPCTIDNGTGPVVIPEGNVHIPCSTLAVKSSLTFGGGNVVFDGDVVIESQGVMTIHACGKAGNSCNPAKPLSWVSGANYAEAEYSSDAAWTFFRSGATIRKAGQASLNIHDSMVYLSKDALYDSTALQLEGGSGSLTWLAPYEGPFENVALWGESEITHTWAGQANLVLEGVFFVPVGHIRYAGNGGLAQVAAQFITERLLVTGSGSLVIAPNTDRAIPAMQARSTLIR